MTGRRWPLDSLSAAADTTTNAALARSLGVNVRTVWRWHRHGLTDAQADHAAIALGLHPALVWPDWLTTSP
jgi:hypothetical protein